MTLKRFLSYCLVTAIGILIGFCVGRFVMPRKFHITVININDLVKVIEKYNALKYEFKEIDEWNEQAITEKPEEERK